jgi:alpha-L-rhamnosidase
MLTTANIRVERLYRPCGVVSAHPEFTWELVYDRDGERQNACAVEVEQVLRDGRTEPCWQSGKLEQEIGESVHYKGPALASRSDYRWRAKIWNAENKEGAWSDFATFETGVIAPDRIGAAWIAGGNALRGKICVGDGLLRARAYVSGLGYYEFYCNGTKVSVAALSPSYTDFDRRVEYEILDLTEALHSGDNLCGFLLANGWWRFSPPGMKRSVQAIAEIVLEYADGRREVIGTSNAWEASDGPFLPETDPSPHQLFDGVSLDLEWLQSGWCSPSGPDPGGWRSARIAEEVVGNLVPALVQPIREIETLPAQTVRRMSENLLSIDFGKNFTGWIRFHANVQKGAVFTMRHAELLHEDGRLNPDTLRTAKQTDTFLMSGQTDGETVEPRLLYHGLQYAEIEGPIDGVDAKSIEGRVIHTDLPVIGEVTTSNERINWLLDALRWTVRGNAMSVMTDVCQRDERRAWLMDGFNGLKSGMLWYDMNALGRKWFEDMAVNQQSEGCLYNDTAPSFACEGWGKMFGIGWQRVVILLPMKLYEVYGDRVLLERAYPVMCRWADYLRSLLKDGLLPKDLCKHGPEHLCVGRRNNDIANTALAIDALRKVAEAGRILGHFESKIYDTIADEMATAAHRVWYDSKNACYGGGENFAQANQIYALRFGICPPAERQHAFDRLVDDMMNGRGTGPVICSGIGSVEHVPFVLSDFGRDDLVWQWLQRDEYPSYGFMQKNGATAIWERWEKMTYNQMNAHNHTGLTGIGVWLMERLVGIRVEPGPEPVFHLRPGIHLPFESLRARWQSRWGELRVEWKTEKTQREMEIVIPPGCVGRLFTYGDNNPVALAAGFHKKTKRIRI